MARRHVLDRRIRAIITAFRKALQQAGIPASKLILFGSRAKGKAKEWSDIDLCVVSRKFGRNRHDETVRLGKIANRIEASLEPLPYHPDDLRNKYDALAAEIRRSGIVVAE